VPSLLFLAGTAPYYHDGSAATLAELIEKNGNRMGNTSHLSPQERADLVAYLERL
jgi:cytochrome c peroxidase